MSASGDGSVLRVWVLTNLPSPYQLELLGAVTADARVRLDVRFMSGSLPADPDNTGRGTFRRMSAIGLSARRDELRLHPAALRECLYGDWDVFVLSGTWASPTLQLCAKILSCRKKAWLLWCERPHPGRDVAGWSRRWISSGPVRWLRNKVMSDLLRSAHGILAIGECARREYHALGVEDSRIRSVPYCCDVDRFLRLNHADTAAFREEQHLADRTVILFSGQLIERKGIRLLADVFLRLAAELPQVALVVLGDGPLRGWLEETLRPVSHRVVFAGRRPQAELPTWFSAADIFFFPTRHDGWGLVINEACGAGLPIVTTHSAGAAMELVQEGQNGFLLDRDDRDGFLKALRELSNSPGLRQSMSQRSREIVSDFRLAPAATRWIESVSCLSEIPCPKGS